MDSDMDSEYVRIIEIQRARVQDAENRLENGLNHLRQLEDSVQMDRRHLKEARQGLGRLESIYAAWKKHKLPHAELCGARRVSEPTPGYAGDNNGE